MSHYLRSSSSGDTVKESGQYIDAGGTKKELHQGEEFPNCPVTGNATTWTHAILFHKTGSTNQPLGIQPQLSSSHSKNS